MNPEEHGGHEENHLIWKSQVFAFELKKRNPYAPLHSSERLSGGDTEKRIKACQVSCAERPGKNGEKGNVKVLEGYVIEYLFLYPEGGNSFESTTLLNPPFKPGGLLN